MHAVCGSEQSERRFTFYHARMRTAPLSGFISENRSELIERCRVKVAQRSKSSATQPHSDHGVPAFLDELVAELHEGTTRTKEIRAAAVRHGNSLYFEGLTVGQVVHAYGDVCQAVTDLAVTERADISATDFRTMNRCLDDAIAGAVAEYGRQQRLADEGQARELQNLVYTALTAFEVLQTGRVGVSGTTGDLVHRSLVALRAMV